MSTATPAPMTETGSSTARLNAAAQPLEQPTVETCPRPSEPGHYVAVQRGADWMMVELTREITHVGRGLSAELRLDDHLVSRRHAIIEDSIEGTRIVDDRSANGVVVNGERVSEADLRDGDVIVLGRTLLRYIAV